MKDGFHKVNDTLDAHYWKCGYLVGQPVSNELGRELSVLLVHKLAIRILVPAHVIW